MLAQIKNSFVGAMFGVAQKLGITVMPIAPGSAALMIDNKGRASVKLNRVEDSESIEAVQAELTTILIVNSLLRALTNIHNPDATLHDHMIEVLGEQGYSPAESSRFVDIISQIGVKQ